MLRIVSHYNFLSLFTFMLGFVIPYSGNFSIDHFSVFVCLLPPTPHCRRTYFFPHQMPLYMRSAYSWWCSHRADGSSVWTRQTLGLQWWPAGLVESWVSRREGSETLPSAGPSCGSAKAKSFRPIPGYNFPLCQAFPPSMLPQHPSPGSFPAWESEAQFWWWTTGISWDEWGPLI